MPKPTPLRQSDVAAILANVVRGQGRLMPKLKERVRVFAHRAGATAVMARVAAPQAHVIIYHKVERRPEGVLGATALDVPLFERHVEFLTRNYEVVPLARLAEELRQGAAPKRAVAITFDDGYRNNLLLAQPVLERHRAPATVFVTAGLVGTQKWMWPNEIAEMVLRSGFTAVGSACGDPLLAALFEADLPANARLDASTEYLIRAGPVRRARVLERLRKRFPVEPDDENRFLSWDEVRALKARGVDIGSHTVNHPLLTQLDLRAVRRELVAARDRIEEELGERPTTFAYPHGDYDEKVKAIASRYYRSAVTTHSGDNTPSTDPFELRRIAAYSVEDLSFELARPR